MRQRRGAGARRQADRAGQPHAQRAWHRREAQRGRPARAPRRRGPTSTGPPERTSNSTVRPRHQAGKAPHLADQLERDELRHVRGGAYPRGHDAEQARVEPRARAGTGQARQLIRVVRDEHERRVVAEAPVRRGELEVDRLGVGAEQVGQHVRPGLELGVAVGVGLDDLGVDAERGVVDEHAVVDTREIDAPLDGRP